MRNDTLARRIVWGSLGACVTVASSLATSEASAASGHVEYFGGHVISHVQVVPVIWGSGVSATVVSGAEPFYAKIVDSPFLDWMGEYDTAGLKGAADMMPGSNQHIYRGTALPTVTIVPSNTNKTISDAEIQTELLAQLKAGKLPAPHVDAEGGVDTLYMVAFPPGMTINDFGGQDVCSGACAYHWTLTAPGISTGVPYGVIPDCSASTSTGCSLGSVFDTYTGDAAHELAEAITDAECGLDNTVAAARPLAWYDPSQAQSGEIGDICLGPSAFVPYQGYLVQTIWSQRLGRCITDDPSLTVCDGTTRPCRPCMASDCATPKSICDATTGACRGCAKDSECTGTTPRCDVPSGSCVACLSDADCKSPDAPMCDPSSHACVANPPTGGGPGDAGTVAPGGGNDAGGSGTNEATGGGAKSGGYMVAPESSPWDAAVLVGAVAVAGRRRRARRRA